MNLEADLGIDSIKRVEILSAVRERQPDLPEPDAETLGRLHTLGEIVEVLGPFVHAPLTRGGETSSPRRSEPAEPLAPLTGPVLQRLDLALRPVAEGARRAVPPVAVRGEGAEALAAALAALGVDAIASHPVADRGVVWIARSPKDDDILEAFLAAKQARLDQQGAFVVVTRQGGDFGLHGGGAPLAAGLYGLAKTVALEHPGALVRAIDTADDTPVEAVALEIARVGPVETALSTVGRRTLSSVVVPSPHRRPHLDHHDVIVVSGGARGVTAACVIELAAQTQARFALLGRSRIDNAESPEVEAAHDEPALMRVLAPTAGSPANLRKQVAAILAAREARATVAAVHAAGGQAIYVPCDVTNTDSVATALASVRSQLGPITGLVHGAGVIHDRKVKEKTAEQWNAVWSTKIDGARALVAATRRDALKLLCFFSSVAARSGNFGQADYAAANEVLNRTAAFEATQRRDCVVKSIGWGPWEGGMVTPALAKAFHARGIALIPLVEGARAFVDELGSPGAVEVVIGGLLAGDKAAPSLRRVNRRDYPFVADHSVAGQPVVPVVLAVEWFAQRARELRSSSFVQGVDNVKVLKGIKLRNYDGEGDVFEIHTVTERADGYSLEVRSGTTVHYRADVQLADTPPVSPAAPDAGSLPSYPHSADTIYDRLLFHGPGFQVIREVEGVGPGAASAALRTTTEAGWPTDGWLTDIAAGDGGLQLAVLWSRQAMRGASLPTAIGSYRPYGRPTPGPVRGVLRGHKLEGKRSLSDVSLVDARGRVYADLRGVELHALPGGEYPGKKGD
ncbi:MAG: SDR family NAD(P)-dependent oxidoreductase [Deltaproteobacteria bacterium]|nr:SDR family NAD(P)-dependent oxidoreductase [Deltaproteobacteria bacterium]